MLDSFQISIVDLSLYHFLKAHIERFQQEESIIVHSLLRRINAQEELNKMDFSLPGAKFPIPRTIFGFQKNRFPHPIESLFSAHQK